MKKLLTVLLCVLVGLTVLCGCRQTPENDDEKLIYDSDGFAFSLTWGTNGDKSYNSVSGRLCNDKFNARSHTTAMYLSQAELQQIETWLREIDVTSYPDEYDPYNDPNSDFRQIVTPSRVVILTVKIDGKFKKISCTNILPNEECFDKNGPAFFETVDKITEMICQTNEWKRLPENTNIYM